MTPIGTTLTELSLRAPAPGDYDIAEWNRKFELENPRPWVPQGHEDALVAANAASARACGERGVYSAAPAPRLRGPAEKIMTDYESMRSLAQAKWRAHEWPVQWAMERMDTLERELGKALAQMQQREFEQTQRQLDEIKAAMGAENKS